MKSNTKKFLAFTAATLILLSSALTGCTKSNNVVPSTNPQSQATAGKKIALVCSAAGANDNGYNQTAIKGLTQLKDETGVEVKTVETTTDYPGTLKTLAQAGYNLIFSLEYDFTSLIEGVGGEDPLAKQFPNTTFVVFNANPNIDASGNTIHNNVISVMFNVNEASFLAGYLSVLVNENAATLFDASKYSFTAGANGRMIQRVKKVVKVPIIAGSGVNTVNIKEQMKIADGAIVGSSLKEGGVLTNPISYELTKALVDALHA